MVYADLYVEQDFSRRARRANQKARTGNLQSEVVDQFIEERRENTDDPDYKRRRKLNRIRRDRDED